MGKVQRKQVQRVGYFEGKKIKYKRNKIRNENKRKNKRLSNIRSPGPSCVDNTPKNNVNIGRELKSSVQHKKSAPQQCIVVHSKKESTCISICNKQIKKRKTNFTSNSIHPESTQETLQETLNQITNNIIIISGSSDNKNEDSLVDSLPETVVVPVITKNDDAVGTNNITIEKNEQNTSLPVNNIQSISHCDDDVHVLVSSSSNNKQNKIETVVKIDTSNEEKKLYQQPIKQPIDSQSIELRRALFDNFNTKKRKYNSPLHNCKSIKRNKSTFDLREFLLEKQRLKEYEQRNNAITFQKHEPSTELKPKLRPIFIDGLNIGYL